MNQETIKAVMRELAKRSVKVRLSDPAKLKFLKEVLPKLGAKARKKKTKKLSTGHLAE